MKKRKTRTKKTVIKNPVRRKRRLPLSFLKTKTVTIRKNILRLFRNIFSLFPQKKDKNAPLLDGNVKILPQFCIQTKLIGCFIIPVIMIIILGVVSYSRSSSALNENYEAAVSQTMNMAKEYFSFVFSNIESDMNVYLSDSDLTAYYSGKYSTNEAQEKSLADLKQKYETASARLDSLKEGSLAYYKAYKEMTESKEEYEDIKDFVEDTKTMHSDTYKSLNASVSNKTAANPFIGNSNFALE